MSYSVLRFCVVVVVDSKDDDNAVVECMLVFISIGFCVVGWMRISLERRATKQCSAK